MVVCLLSFPQPFVSLLVWHMFECPADQVIVHRARSKPGPTPAVAAGRPTRPDLKLSTCVFPQSSQPDWVIFSTDLKVATCDDPSVGSPDVLDDLLTVRLEVILKKTKGPYSWFVNNNKEESTPFDAGKVKMGSFSLTEHERFCLGTTTNTVQSQVRENTPMARVSISWSHSSAVFVVDNLCAFIIDNCGNC